MSFKLSTFVFFGNSLYTRGCNAIKIPALPIKNGTIVSKFFSGRKSKSAAPII